MRTKYKYIIFDIDGVLADSSHRLLHIQKDPKDWDSFFRPDLMILDSPIKPAIELLNFLIDSPHYFCDDLGFLFFTGRPERTQMVTSMWLQNNVSELRNHMIDEMRMRPDGDRRNDDILKEEWLLELGTENVLCAFEDRTRIVEMYRRHGVTCYQSARGDF